MTDTSLSLAALSATGAFLGGAVALWSVVWGPWAKRRTRRRNAEAEDRAYRRETHQALYGIPERRDDAGALISQAKPGLVASMAAMRIDVAVLKAEFPVNGVPARTAIDATNAHVSDLRRDLSRHVTDKKAHRP